MTLNLKKVAVEGIFIVVLLILFSFIINTSQFVADGSLDPSWQNSYNYFHFKLTQFGSNIAFTYGPLAYLHVQAYNPDLYWAKIVFSMIFALVACLVMLFARRTFGLISSIVLSCALIICSGHDSFIFSLQLFMIAVFLLNKKIKSNVYYRIIIILVLALTGLIKFTFLLSGLALISMLVIECFLFKKWKYPMYWIFGYLISIAIIWMALGQNISNLPSYLFNSLEISNGYNEAMAISGPFSTVIVAIFLIMMCLSIVPLQIINNVKIHVNLILLLLCICGFIFISWKHGFVRQDAHIAEFYSFMTFIYSLLFSINYKKLNPNKEHVKWLEKKKIFKYIDNDYLVIISSNVVKRFVALIMVFLSISAFGYTFYTDRFIVELLHTRLNTLEDKVRLLSSPSTLIENKKTLDLQYSEMTKKLDLPQIKYIVGNKSVDIYNYYQGYVIYNSLNWKPRPVFQSYSSYSSKLLELNKNYLIDNGSEFVLFQNQTIDNRFPLMDDSLWIRALLHNYKFITEEKGFLLFQRISPNTNVDSKQLEFLSASETTFDKTINIDTDKVITYASINITSSFFGKVRGLFFKPAEVNLIVSFLNGQEKKYRIIPGMVKEPFLLSPLNETNDDVIQTLIQENSKIIKSIRISTATGTRYFNPNINVSLYGDHLSAQPEIVNYQKSLWSDIINRLPEKIEADHPLERIQINNASTVLFHPKASMEFKLKSEDSVLHAVVGIRPEAKEKGKSDGVRFYWEAYLINEWKSIKELDLTPDSFDQDFIEFSTELPSDIKYNLVRLRVDYGQSNNSSWDWAVIKELDIK